MHSRALRASRVRHILWTLFAVVLTVSMMLVCSMPAMAENTAQGITSTGTDADSSSSNSSDSAETSTQDSPDSSDISGSDGSDDSADSADSAPNDSRDSQSTGQDNTADESTNTDANSAATTEDESKFVNDFTAACESGADERVITITGDLSLTKTGLEPKCNIRIISDGAPHTITWGGGASVFWPRNGITVTIGETGNEAANNLTFTNNGAGNPLFHNYSTVTINGGTFTNSSAERGAVVYNSGTLNINGGTFANNTATGVGGGVIYQDGGTTVISGGTFTGNKQELAACTRTNDGNTTNECRLKKNQNIGGGAIHTDAGTLTIQGDVKFQGNHANAAAFMSGGGAIYAKGTLWILNDMDDSSKKPLFDGNWTAVGVGDENTQYMNNDAKAGVLPTGGAGGAIFLQNGNSKGYFMGGEYKNNTSGYLGGAIYTEEGSVSYVGKAVATANVAGHFGGGLWLCPSGSAQASEGGNIAMFGNSVNYNIDANADNHGDQYMAGDDFAMMNPKGKNRGENQNNASEATSVFRLLNTWFMDRSEQAVNWYWDGTPKTAANGFADKYQAPDWKWSDIQAPNLQDNVSRYTDDKYPQRYAEGSSSNIEVKAPSDLLVTNPKGHGVGKQKDDPTRTETDSSLTLYTGIAMKSQLTEYGKNNTETVKNNAALTFTNNAARLSGGAFGSNGVVSFSSPYAASWNKVDADDTTKFLKGSVWTLKTPVSGGEAGGAMNPNLRPADCTTSTRAGALDSCWHTVTDADGEWLSVQIVDNGSRDTNPEDGKIGVDNLKPGTYYLTEFSAPDNYKPTANVYKFVIAPEADGLQKEVPKIEISERHDDSDLIKNDSTAIGNTLRSGGVSWSKINTVSDVTKKDYLAGSEWKLTKYEDAGFSSRDISFAEVTVDDYVSSDVAERKCTTETGLYCDVNSGTGRFTLASLPLGYYKLVEFKAPEGYVQPDADDTFYTFAVEDGKTSQLTKWENGEKTSESGTEVVNAPTEISWQKVDADRTSKLLAGSEWTISKWDGTNFTDPRVAADCKNNACSLATNTEGRYVDKDPREGHFTIQNLDRDAQYKLVETKAPEGYALPDSKTTYAIITVDTNGKTKMTLYGTWNQSKFEDTRVCFAPTAAKSSATAAPASVTSAGDDTECVLTNVQTISSLPFTGGLDARSWILIGGIAAVTAAIALALINEYRKRKGLSS